MTNLMHPVSSWYQARAYFQTNTGRRHEAVLYDNSLLIPGDRLPDAYQQLYSNLLLSEGRTWQACLGRRLRNRGWNADHCIQGAKTLPRSVPQGYFWNLFRFDLNGHYTQARFLSAGVVPAAGPCPPLRKGY